MLERCRHLTIYTYITARCAKVTPIKYIPVDSFIRNDDVCNMRTKCVNGTYCYTAEEKVTGRKEGEPARILLDTWGTGMRPIVIAVK